MARVKKIWELSEKMDPFWYKKWEFQVQIQALEFTIFK